MQSGQRLAPGQEFRANGVTLRYQEDGNLVLYDRRGPRWATDTHGRSAGHVEMQGDGFLVIYDGAGTPIWRSGDVALPGGRLLIDDTGLRIVASVEVPTWQVRLAPREPGELPPAVGHPRALEGQVSCDGVSFRDRTGPVNPVFLHAGDLIGQGLKFGASHVEPDVALAAQAEYQGLRSWFQLYIRPGDKWLRGPTEDGWSPLDDRQRFRDTLGLAVKYRLKWHIAGAGIRHMSNAQEDEVFDELARAMADVGPEHFAVVEACNEVRDTGDDDDVDPRELTRLIDRVRSQHPQVMYALSAYTGTEDGDVLRHYTKSFVPFVLVHGYRDGRAHDKIRHTFNNGYEGGIRRNWLQGEPVGVGRLVSATAHKHELTGHVMASMAAAATISRQWWTFMSGPGVVLNDERFEDMPGFFETPKVVHALPRDVATWDVLGHSGDRFRGQRIHAVTSTSPNVRADYAINSRTGEYAEITYGPPNESTDLPQERQTRDEVVVEQGEWARVTVGRLA